MKKAPTTQLTMARLRRDGYIAAVVERWSFRRTPFGPAPGKRHDLFGCADIIACHPLHRIILLVQATSRSNVSSRLSKARKQADLGAWLESGGRFEVWGWDKPGSRWRVRRVRLEANDVIMDLEPKASRQTKTRLLPCF